MATESFLKMEEQRSGRKQKFARMVEETNNPDSMETLEKMVTESQRQMAQAIQDAQAETRARVKNLVK